MSAAPSLLDRLQRLIESSYDWSTGIEEIGAFIVGDEGYRAIYAKRSIEEILTRRFGARTLVTWEGAELRARVYYPDRMILLLERHNPLRVLNDTNLLPFSVLVEELDHLLMLAWCCGVGREVRLVELEFHANLTQYLVLCHFLGRLSRRTRLSPSQRKWIMDHLFEMTGEGMATPLGERYRTAAWLARRFIQRLDQLAAAERLPSLRRFTRQPWQEQRRSLES